MAACNPCVLCGAIPTRHQVRIDGRRRRRGVCVVCAPVARAQAQERVRENAQRWGAGFTYKMRSIAS